MSKPPSDMRTCVRIRDGLIRLHSYGYCDNDFDAAEIARIAQAMTWLIRRVRIAEGKAKGGAK